MNPKWDGFLKTFRSFSSADRAAKRGFPVIGKALPFAFSLAVLLAGSHISCAAEKGDVFGSSSAGGSVAASGSGGSGTGASESSSAGYPTMDFGHSGMLTEEEAEAMISDEAAQEPAADPSTLPDEVTETPSFTLSDEEMAALGVPQSVIDATKGSGMSSRDEWACTCLLCLANPNGWRSVSECRPPVKKLFKHLKKHSMPKCPNAGSGNDMVLVTNPVNPCRERNLEDVTGWIYVPGSGPVHSSAYQNEGTDYCVQGYQKSRRMCVEHDEEGYCTRYANVKYYDEVEWNPHDSPYSIDVIIDGQVFKRTHGWQ